MNESSGEMPSVEKIRAQIRAMEKMYPRLWSDYTAWLNLYKYKNNQDQCLRDIFEKLNDRLDEEYRPFSWGNVRSDYQSLINLETALSNKKKNKR